MSLPDILLASSSPRRSQLLGQMGLCFRVKPMDADETLPEGASPEEAALVLARRKAWAAMECEPEALVIAADTLVVAAGRILGKPADSLEAAEMLRILRGCVHEVVTGVCVAWKGRLLTACERTSVSFDHMTDVDIDNYVSTGEPLDKAGAYGIQGRAGVFINRIEGCYYNVMGLPLATLKKLLEQALGENGFRLLISWNNDLNGERGDIGVALEQGRGG
jgi:septum formation protein